MAHVLLETEHLSIRRFVEGDLSDLVEYRTRPDVARYQDWTTDWNLSEAERFLESPDEPELGTRGEWTQLAVIERRSGALCGDIGVHFVAEQPATAEVGIAMSPRFQGRGFATEAMRSVVSWLFMDFGLHRVFAHVDARNADARSLLERLGFRQEAELQDADWFKSEWTTLCIYAVLADGWQCND